MEQLTLSFEPGISSKYSDLLECVTAGVYRIGLSKVAGKLDTAPSNLSAACSGARHFGIDHLETYLDAFDDLDPVFYLIDKYLTDKSARDQAQALVEANRLMGELKAVIKTMNGGGR